MSEKPQGDFFDSHCTCSLAVFSRSGL